MNLKTSKRYLLLLVVVLCHGHLPVFSQGEFNNWYFGATAAITFNTSPPTNIPSTQMGSVTSSVSVSDSNGLVLFYANGQYVYDRNHNIMSTQVWGMNSNQPVFTVKKPGENYLYWIFNIRDPTGFPPSNMGLFSSVIDMTLNGGLGGVVPTQHNIPVPGADNAFCKLTGIRHQNNLDAWVVTRDNSEHFLSYLISTSGLSGPVISQSSVETFVAQRSGDIRISQDGKKMVANYAGNVVNYGSSSVAEFCTFNSYTGMIVPLFKFYPVIDTVGPFGPVWAEFSPNSQLLYIGGNVTLSPTTTTFGIFQYDATKHDSTGFMKSQVFLGYVNGPGGTRGLQMAPNGKIYSCFNSSDMLNVINNPNVSGLSCGFQINALNLDGKICFEGLPQFLQKYKSYLHLAGTCCMAESVTFSTDIWPPADTIRWNFGDPASGVSNVSFLPAPSHLFSNPGTYTVELYVRHNDNRTDTTWRTITIHPSPQPALGPDKTICIGNSITFDAGFCTGCSYEWKNLGTGQVVGTNQNFTTSIAGTYAVKVTNGNNCSGYDTVQLVTTPVPQVTNTKLTKSICSGESTNIALSSSVSGTMFHWTASLVSGNITGFSADSGLVINQILVDNLPTAGVVTYSVILKVGSCSGNAVDFTVTVNPGDSAKVSVSASANNICAGTQVTFTAVPTNPGAAPIYQWKVNGILSGNNSPVFTHTPVNGDQIHCVMTSSMTVCVSNNPAASNIITMTVNPLLPVSVAVSASANNVCAGTPVTFTAVPVNGGSAPSYLWKVNGIPMGTNSPVYSYVPGNNDAVTCTLSSSETCIIGNPATSPATIMTVSPQLPASVSIAASANPFCRGTSVTFTATPVNGGASPVYQWKVNGISVLSAINATYSYPASNGDVVQCVMTSNLVCVTSNPATSTSLTMIEQESPNVSFTDCFDTITTVNAKPFRLKGGLPLGGTYSGPGVNYATGIFTPSTAGPGTHTITYTYTNTLGCSSISQSLIHSFTQSLIPCGSTLTDIRDGNVYPTVQIGSQCWMQKNLDYGTTIPTIIHQTDNCIAEQYLQSSIVNPGNRKSIYQWDELMRYESTPGSQGLCPPGWHIPSESDWNILFDYYDGQSRAGVALTDPFLNGFKADPDGVLYQNTIWSFADFAVLFWSSTPVDATRAWSHGMNDINFSVSSYPALKADAFPVRCVRD